MLHPFFSTLIRRPDLVVDHLAGYGTLVHEEVSDAGKQFVQRAVAWAVALVLAVIFLILVGIAIILGCTQGVFHWALVAVPGAALLMAMGAVLYARSPVTAARFAGLKAQLNADIHALKAAGENA